VLSKSGENFAVKFDMFCFENVYELAVRGAVYARPRVYFYAPQGASYALFLSVVVKTVYARVQKPFARLAFL